MNYHKKEDNQIERDKPAKGNDTLPSYSIYDVEYIDTWGRKDHIVYRE